jgi:hypothetical protein
MDPDSDPGGPKTCGSGFGSATMLEFLKQTYLIFIIEVTDEKSRIWIRIR